MTGLNNGKIIRWSEWRSRPCRMSCVTHQLHRARLYVHASALLAVTAHEHAEEMVRAKYPRLPATAPLRKILYQAFPGNNMAAKLARAIMRTRAGVCSARMSVPRSTMHQWRTAWLRMCAAAARPALRQRQCLHVRLNARRARRRRR